MMTNSIQIRPSLEEFQVLSQKGNLVPVYCVISSDNNTPVGVFQKLRTDYSFLLESAERTGQMGRYSFVGRNPGVIFRSNGNEISLTEDGQTRSFQTEGYPLRELERLMNGYHHVPIAGLPPFVGGAVGYLGYDAVRHFEPTKLKPARNDPLKVPESIYMIAKQIVCFDHLERRLYLISNASIVGGDIEGAYRKARREVLALVADLRKSANLPHISLEAKAPEIQWKSNTRERDFKAMVNHAQKLILSGDIIQVVLSQRFETEYTGDPLHLYRTLWMINPSPYMFYITFGSELSLVGSSPEVHVKCMNGKVQIRPIAGTRRRGDTPERDVELAKELLEDPKEMAEHVMLLDLARNDIGRIAEFGSVQVTEKFQIERFSHVMHIVSNVIGQKLGHLTSYDVMRATFPAGTVSGAPKIRAMQIISDLEKYRRGPYSGAVGYFGFDGNHDSCIALRTVVIKDSKAYVQAGAGIVADSTPDGEFEETRNKAKGMLLAIARANAMKVKKKEKEHPPMW